MTGKWVARQAGAPQPGHARLTLRLDDGARGPLPRPAPVRPAAAGAGPGFDRAGPTSRRSAPTRWPPPSISARLGGRLAATRRAVKVALLDQALLAGVGNIHASEACWRARLDPRRRGDSLSPAEVARLARAIRPRSASAWPGSTRRRSSTWRRGARTRSTSTIGPASAAATRAAAARWSGWCRRSAPPSSAAAARSSDARLPSRGPDPTQRRRAAGPLRDAWRAAGRGGRGGARGRPARRGPERAGRRGAGPGRQPGRGAAAAPAARVRDAALGRPAWSGSPASTRPGWGRWPGRWWPRR